MYDFRDHMAKTSGMDLLIYTNPEGLAKNINPIDHGSAIHTDIMKTAALKARLDEHKFDIAIGGARRDEEKSRAKERIFFRFAQVRISGIQKISDQKFGTFSILTKKVEVTSGHSHYQIGPRWIFGNIFIENEYQSSRSILPRNGQLWSVMAISLCWMMIVCSYYLVKK